MIATDGDDNDNDNDDEDQYDDDDDDGDDGKNKSGKNIVGEGSGYFQGCHTEVGKGSRKIQWCLH